MSALHNSERTFESSTFDQIWKTEAHVSEAEIFQIVVSIIVCSIVSLFGTVANIINLIVFYKQGLVTTINISFFSMACSDIGSLIMQQWYNVCMNPAFANSNVPIARDEIMYITAGLPRAIFSRITCLITVYVTAERCLCIAFPLRVKQMITPRRTSFVIVIIYVTMMASLLPVYSRTYFDWKFYPNRNRTLLGISFIGNIDTLEWVLYALHSLIGTVAFIAVVVFTSILIRNLREKSMWRQMAAGDREKSEAMTSRDRKTVNIVVLIACILIVSYLPGVLLMITTFFEPEFSIVGKYRNIFFVAWAYGFLFEAINSSVNIFLYLKMSTNYRQTFLSLFKKHGVVS